jgi:hypothetical protein
MGPSPHALFERFHDDLEFPLVEGARELHATISKPVDELVTIDVLRLSYEREYSETTSVQRLVSEAREHTDAVMAAFFDALRSRGRQPWLGLTGTHHEPEIWRVLDLARQVRYPRPAIALGVIRIVDPEAVASPDSVRALLSDLNTPIALPDALLADAGFFQWQHAPEGGTVAVLLAAIAAEVGVKEVLRATAGEKRELGEVLLSKPRDFSVAARILFSDVMTTINGRSLKRENPALEKAVGALFETRNRIAHRGETPTAAEALTAVRLLLTSSPGCDR